MSFTIVVHSLKHNFVSHGRHKRPILSRRLAPATSKSMQANSMAPTTPITINPTLRTVDGPTVAGGQGGTTGRTESSCAAKSPVSKRMTRALKACVLQEVETTVKAVTRHKGTPLVTLSATNPSPSNGIGHRASVGDKPVAIERDRASSIERSDKGTGKGGGEHIVPFVPIVCTDGTR